MSEPADVLVIGGGTAGSVLAARLSEDPGTRVVLVEAGADTPPAATPADIRDTFPSSSLNPAYFWSGLTAVRSDGRPPRPFPQARVMGGGSSVMGLWALRGLPADYDAWVAAGADGWGWSDVCETFRGIEDDADRPAVSGATMPIRRVPRRDWPGFLPTLEQAAAARGLTAIDDINEQPGDGFFPMPVSQSEDQRSSNAACYLTETVRRRPNLTILAQATATELTFEGGVATGARIAQGGGTTVLTARQVVLTAGAVHSPALLMRSGIGPAEVLAAAGVAVRADRAGVGRNLQNHAYLHFALTLPPRLRMPAALRRFALRHPRLLRPRRLHGGRPPPLRHRPRQPARLRHRCRDGRRRALRAVLAGVGDARRTGRAGAAGGRLPDVLRRPRRSPHDRRRPCRRGAAARTGGGGALWRVVPAAAGDVAATVQPARPVGGGAGARGDAGARRAGAAAATPVRARHPPRPLARSRHGATR